MPSFPAAPDEHRTLALLARLEADDAAGWEELYKRYHDRLLFAVRSRLGSKLRGHLESEDVLQSVAIEAFQSLRHFEYRGPGSLDGYLQKLVLNKIRDLAAGFGAQKRAGSVPLDSVMLSSLAREPGGPAPEYFDSERYDRLERALGAMPDEMRELLLLRKVDGLSSLEIAERWQRSDAAVRKAYSRALARLSTLMA